METLFEVLDLHTHMHSIVGLYGNAISPLRNARENAASALGRGQTRCGTERPEVIAGAPQRVGMAPANNKSIKENPNLPGDHFGPPRGVRGG